MYFLEIFRPAGRGVLIPAVGKTFEVVKPQEQSLCNEVIVIDDMSPINEISQMTGARVISGDRNGWELDVKSCARKMI